MAVSQCPFCELRFEAKWELNAHLDSDHPGRVEQKNRADKGVIIEDGDADDPKPL